MAIPKTNKDLSETPLFIELCARAKCTPSIRQASKFLNCRGKAYRQAVKEAANKIAYVNSKG